MLVYRSSKMSTSTLDLIRLKSRESITIAIGNVERPVLAIGHTYTVLYKIKMGKRINDRDQRYIF